MQVTIPDQLSNRLHRLAPRQQSIETILTTHLFTPLDDQLGTRPTGEQAELCALHPLPDNTRHAIMTEKVLPAKQNQMAVLMTKNSLGQLSEQEQVELGSLVEHGDQLMLRKAETAAILTHHHNSESASTT